MTGTNGSPDDIDRERERRRLAEERSRTLERDLLAAERRARTAERRLGRVLAVPPVRAALTARRALLAARSRLAMALPRAANVPGAIRYRIGRWWRLRGLRASQPAEAAFIARVLAESPPPARSDGPLVSIVMLNRNGEALLRRLLPALDVTDYRPIELIVVDNGSTDRSLMFLESAPCRFPVRVIRNGRNAPYGEANDQGVAAAAGELVLLLNNDVEPINPGWLGHLVDTLLDGDAVAVGARLVYPRRRGARRAGEQHADLSLQHRGVQFVLDNGLAVPRVLGAGDDAFGPEATTVSVVPALTAACLLMTRATYSGLGGFSPGYDYGWEDMDFCLRLRAGGGRLVHDGRAVLFHHESTTRVQSAPAVARARLEANRARFVETWAPRLFREVLLDALEGAGRWTRAPLRVRVVVGRRARQEGAEQLATDLESMGYEVVRADRADASPGRPAGSRPGTGTTDVVVSLDPGLDVRALPGNPVTVAWIAAEAEAWVTSPWFDRYDIVLAPAEDARRRVEQATAKVASPVTPGTAPGPHGAIGVVIRDALRDWAVARRYAVRTGPPSHDVAPRWGDTWFGQALQRELERAGHPARVEVVPEWTEPGDARADVTLHLFGRSHAPTRAGQLNVLWQISHPDLATPELYERYALVFVASDSFAARMAPHTRVPVAPLHQATDPARFHPAEDGPAHELLFVGNSRNVRRRILDDLLPTPHELAVYGVGWTPDLLDPRYFAGPSIPNHELHRYYGAAAVVLSDHWPDMRDEGFIANRPYDVLASGGFVISDDVEGIDAEFDGAVVTYRTAAELHALVARWLADPEGRRDRADLGRAAVLARHTFAHRAAAILAAVEPRLESWPSRVAGE